MKTFIRNVFYFSKEGCGSLSFLFWTMAYPILLACFFYFSLFSLRTTSFEPIPVAVSETSPTAYVLPEIDLFKTTVVASDEAGLSLVEQKEVDAYIDSEVNVTFNKQNGMAQTLLLSFTDQFLQALELGEAANYLDFSVDYTTTREQKSDPFIVQFHVLLASVCFYSLFGALSLLTQLQGNRSAFGSRIAVSPVKKLQFITSSFFVSMLLNVLSNTILLLFITYVLNLSLFTMPLHSLALLFLGNLCGSAFGFFVASYIKKEETQLMVALGLNLFLSAMAGLMGLFLKFYINQLLPSIAQYNPIALVTDTLYRINFLDDFSSFNYTVIVLVLYTLLFLGLSTKQLRRVRYDSL